MKKIIIITFIFIPVILILLAGSIYIYYNSQKVSYTKNARGDVKSNITISRNFSGIPIIQANSMEDVYFALGFVHAQDRLAIMEYYRTIASASKSGFFGINTEPMEKIVKTLGIPLKARSIAEKIQKPYRDYLDAYAKGVNTARKRNKLRKDITREWNSTDVISNLLLWEICHAYVNNTENIFQFTENISRTLLKSIFPENYLSFYSKEDEKNIILIRKIKDTINKHIGSYNNGFSIFMGPKKIKGGHPLTAFNYSSSLNVYPVLYPVEIQFGNTRIDGITMTGIPFILSGNNLNIDFFGFNLNTDTQEFIVEKTQIIDGSPHYLSGTGWKKFGTIRVPFYDANNTEVNEIIMTTDSGPVLNSIFRDDKHYDNIITLKMIFPREEYIQLLFDIPFAENIEKASSMVKNIYSLPKVYLFADNNRSIKSYSGKIPVKIPGSTVFKRGISNDNDYLTDLSNFTYINESHAAAGSSILFDAPPVIKNNSICNDALFSGITRQLDKKTNNTISDVIDIISDSKSLNAEKFIQKFLVLLGNNPITSARLTRFYFNDWNMHMDAINIAPAIFNVILKNFIYDTYEDEINANDYNSINNMDYVIENYNLLADKFFSNMERVNFPLFDKINTEDIETIGMIFDKAFIKSMRYLNRKKGPIMENWKWGSIHRGHFKIPKNQYSLIAEFINKIDDQDFGGGISTIYDGKFNADFEPVSISTLIGSYYKKEPKIYMNYSVSTNPFSEFYYGKFRHSDAYFIDYQNLDSLQTQTITPVK